MMEDCDSVACMLAHASQNQCKLNSLVCKLDILMCASEYANMLPKMTTLKKEVEDCLLLQYPLITSAEEVISWMGPLCIV